jgi:GNAT superfamily N-acetyltransferase
MAIRNMRLEDIPCALSLINDEGWNYTSVELERMLKLDPDGSFLYVADVPLGVATSVSYGHTGVLGHLVVSKKGRGRKIGQTLLNHCMDYFDSVGADSVILYATQDGERLYSRIGFAKKHKTLCVNAKIPQASVSPKGLEVQMLEESDISDVIALDAEMFGDDRSKLMSMLCNEFPKHSMKVSRGKDLVGFILARETPIGYDLGPWVCASDNPEDAMNLFAAEISTFSRGTMFLGAFAENVQVARLARGLEKQMSWQVDLMVRGGGRYERDISKVFGVSAFELG